MYRKLIILFLSLVFLSSFNLDPEYFGPICMSLIFLLGLNEAVIFYSPRAQVKRLDELLPVVVSKYPNMEIVSALLLVQSTYPYMRIESVRRLGRKRPQEFLIVTADNREYLVDCEAKTIDIMAAENEPEETIFTQSYKKNYDSRTIPTRYA